MKKTYITTLTIYIVFFLDLVLKWRVFPRSIPLIVYGILFGVTLGYLMIRTIYQVFNSTKSYRERFVTFGVGLVLLFVGALIGLIYFLFTPQLIAFCEGAPVYANLTEPFECHPNYAFDVYTRKIPFGPNQRTENFFVDCDGQARVRNHEYVDTQCKLLK